jgi:hypothetical protein
MPLYGFTEDMGQISGRRGAFEAQCRRMLFAGLAWLEAHPDANPQFSSVRVLCGVVDDDNDDAKALSDAVMAAADGDCTDAMHESVITACLFVKDYGWDGFQAAMRSLDAKRRASPIRVGMRVRLRDYAATLSEREGIVRRVVTSPQKRKAWVEFTAERLARHRRGAWWADDDLEPCSDRTRRPSARP